MNDTPAHVEARIEALLAERSGSDRIRMACEMFTLGRALMIANIRAESPEISDVQLRLQIFDRTYGDDLDPKDRERFIRRLQSTP